MVSLIVLVLFGLLYFFYLKDWIKPAPVDLSIVKNITYFNEKPANEYETVMMNILEQCRGALPVNEDMTYTSTNVDRGLKRYSHYDNVAKHLTITYYFREEETIEKPFGETFSYVYVNIFSNNSVMGSDQDSDENEIMSGTDFLDVNSTVKFKRYYASEHGKFRPIFDLIDRKGKTGNFKYLISPFCNIKNEYGFVDNRDNASVDMYFAWVDYTIAINEYTDNYIDNYKTPIVLEDLEAILKQAEKYYSDLL